MFLRHVSNLPPKSEPSLVSKSRALCEAFRREEKTGGRAKSRTIGTVATTIHLLTCTPVPSVKEGSKQCTPSTTTGVFILVLDLTPSCGSIARRCDLVSNGKLLLETTTAMATPQPPPPTRKTKMNSNHNTQQHQQRHRTS